MNKIVIPCCMCNKDVFVSKRHLKYRKTGPYCKNCRKIHLQDCHNKKMLLKYGTINKNEIQKIIQKIINQKKLKLTVVIVIKLLKYQNIKNIEKKYIVYLVVKNVDVLKQKKKCIKNMGLQMKILSMLS